MYLTAARQHGKDRTAIMQEVGYGRPFLDGFRGWANVCQLWDPSAARLTELGERLLEHDAELTDPISAWIIHTLLCSNSPFWQWLFGTFLRAQYVFNSEDVLSALEEAGLVLSSGLRPHLQAILATYHKAEALGVLEIVARDGGGQMRVDWAQNPPAAVYAWALYRFVYSKTEGQSQEIGLSELLNETASPCVHLYANPARAEAGLEALSQRGWITLRRYAYPYTVAVEITSEEQSWMLMYE